MKLLLALRFLGFAGALLTIVLPWLVPGTTFARFAPIRRLGLALGLGAELALTATKVARGHAPWTKLVFPVIGALAAFELTTTRSFPMWALAAIGTCELALVGYVMVRALSAARGGDDYPETVIAREFARFVDRRVARYFALETTLVFASLRYLFGGFRRRVPLGFSYDRASDVPLLLALPIFVVLPEMIVVDLLLPASAWGWRIASDVLHVYLMLYIVGAYATFRERPHRIEANRVRFSFGAFQTLDLTLDAIVCASALPATFDGRAWRRAHATDGCSLLVSGAPVVEIELVEPLTVAGLFRTRAIRRLAVSADRPHDLVRALAALSP